MKVVLSCIKQSTTNQHRNIIKMKKIKKMALLSVLIAGMVGCNKTIVGDGPLVAENRPVSNFTSINLLVDAEVYYHPGNNLSLEVMGQQNILDKLETIVTNDQLIIRNSDSKDISTGEKIRINITAPSVNTFSINTAGEIYSSGKIEVTNLQLSNSGTGTICLQNVVAKNIEATGTSSGVIVAEGSGENVTTKNSGSGKIDFSRVIARTAKVRASGSGKTQVTVADHLQATIEGSGPVYYSGYPDVSSHISGTGHLVHL